MVERLTSKSVEFAFPFVLGGIDGLQPAGVYQVETIEEQIDGLSFVAYRRLSTTIALRAGSKTMHVRQFTAIDPADLAAALERDATACLGSSN
jgi:hypothetical protein